MGTRIKRLTDKAVKNKRTPGRYADGNGLYLVVGADGNSKWWVLLYRRGRVGKKGRGELGLGKYPDVTLAAARVAGGVARRQIAQGIDPVTQRKQERQQRWLAKAKSMTFLQIAEDLFTQKTAGDNPWWGDHARTKQRGILDGPLKPLHGLPVNSAEAADIITLKMHKDIVGPQWLTKPPMMRDIKYLAAAICDHAYGLKVLPMNVANPAGKSLDVLLGARQRKGGHWYAIPYQEAPALYATLDELSKPNQDYFSVREAARAVGKPAHYIQRMIEDGRLPAIKGDRRVMKTPIPYEWQIKPEDLFKRWPKVVDVIPGIRPVTIQLVKFSMLIGSRPSEARLMLWDEYHEDERLLVIPWQRTKEGQDIRQDMVIPLSDPANDIVLMMRAQQQRDGIDSNYVFANYPSRWSRAAKIGQPPSHCTVLNNLRTALPPKHIKRPCTACAPPCARGARINADPTARRASPKKTWSAPSATPPVSARPKWLASIAGNPQPSSD
jgi:hypothetical protein